MRHVGGSAAEHENRYVQAGHVGLAESGYERVVAGAVGDHPSVHHVDELLAIHGEEAVSVSRVALQHLLPLVELDNGFIPPCHAASIDGMQ